jgi:hypothetical protein
MGRDSGDNASQPMSFRTCSTGALQSNEIYTTSKIMNTENMIKYITIPLVAFAITVTSASAFTGNGWWQEADIDLSADEVAALEAAHETRQGARVEARSVLQEAGIDAERHAEIRMAAREARDMHRQAVQSAIEDEDYDAFKEAVEDRSGPLAEAVDSEADFEVLVEAHQLRLEGLFQEAATLLEEELGLDQTMGPRAGLQLGDGDHRGVLGGGQGNGQKGGGGRNQ